MKRNLESRVEVVVPVEDDGLRKELRTLLDIQLNDRRNVWEMQPDGSFVQLIPADEAERKGCQQQAIELAMRRAKKAVKFPKKGPKSLGRNLR